MNLNTRLLKTLGFGYVAFWITGLFISWFFVISTVTLLIDRSYCPSNQWQQVSQTYAQLYHQHQRRQLHLQTVILFSSLGQEVLNSPPLPRILETLPTYGYSDRQRQARLQTAYPKARLLNCH